MGKALVDTNVLVGAIRNRDALHERAATVLKELKEKYEAWVLNLVIQETATVLSMRDGMNAARTFYNGYKDIIDTEIPLNEDLEKHSWQIFLKQLKKGTSFVDCANLAVIQHYRLDGIVTFDEFYPKEVRLRFS